jgi:hypothetical protein
MKRNKKILGAATAAIVIAFVAFFAGCICTEHWMLGIGFDKAVDAFCHGLDDGFRL